MGMGMDDFCPNSEDEVKIEIVDNRICEIAGLLLAINL